LLNQEENRKEFQSVKTTYLSVNEVWNRVYSSDSSFFGEDPSNFGLNCYEEFKQHGVKKILELGCGQGRDTIFFASNGLDVVAIDSSQVAIDELSKIITEKNLPIKAMVYDASKGIPFDNSYFDAVYSQMFFNMRFTDEQLKYLFVEVNRVLKDGGLNLFSVRSDNDAMYKKGTEVEKNIYDINGFQIRFFTKPDLKKISLSNGFEPYKITEAYEEPASLYCVFARKKKLKI
jgi:SAM-dependent methyltransferase